VREPDIPIQRTAARHMIFPAFNFACILILQVLGTFGHPVEDREVCVVGAGPAGIYAARLLQDEGYDVVVFEKSSVVGGKTVPPKSPSGTDIVRHLFTGNQSMATVGALLGQYNIPLTPYLLNNFTAYLGSNVINASSIQPSQAQLDAIATFLNLIAPTTDIYTLAESGNFDNVPAELQVSFREWLMNNGIQAVEPLLYRAVTNYGYGFFDSTPAIYVLKYLDFFSVQASLTSMFMLAPFHTLIEMMAADLDVRLNSEVTRIHPNVAGQSPAFVQVQNSPPTTCGTIKTFQIIFAVHGPARS